MAALAHVDPQGVRRRQSEQLGRRQRVVDDRVGFAQHLRAAHGDQVGVSRSGADQVRRGPGPARAHASASARSCASKASPPSRRIASAARVPSRAASAGGPSTSARRMRAPSLRGEQGPQPQRAARRELGVGRQRHVAVGAEPHQHGALRRHPLRRGAVA